MHSTEVAVHVGDVSKSFRLPLEKQTTIKGALVNFARRKRGYEEQKVLKNISFDINKGEFFGIVGRNGSGKSTLLKLLAGIYSPDKGGITIDGRLTPFIELGVGFNPELTGRENVFLNGALLGFNRKEMRSMYDDIVEFAGIERFMDQKLKNYSSGMQVRLAFSIAIRAESDILLIDEVLAVGDMLFQQKCFETFKEIKKRGKTVVFVSHDLGAVEAFCDRALLINNGNMEHIGPTREIIQRYSNLLADAEAAEEERRAEKKGEKKKADVIHSGTGDAVTVEDAEVLNGAGKKVRVIEEGEPFVIRVHYDAKRDIFHPVVGIGIMDDENLSIVGPNTQEADFATGTLSGEGHIDIAFRNNVLAPGSYTLRAAIFDRSGAVPYDFAENLLKFKVSGKKRHGKVFLKPEWKIVNKKS
jgi:ABC-2 type transport system ATP-binding protein